MIKQFLTVICVGLLCNVARAEGPANCQMTVATGPKGRIYSQLFRDIRAVCGSEVELCEQETQGGLQNTQELAASKVELGFVQEDTLWGMKDTDERIAALRAVAMLNTNMLHILSLRSGYAPPKNKILQIITGDDRVEVKRASELRGLPVVVVGSARTLVPALDKGLGLGLKIESADSEEQALARLRSGEVAAMLSMSGWPSPLIETLAKDDNVQLVDFDLPVHQPLKLVKKNYPKLEAFNLTFVSVRNLLLTRPVRSDGPYGVQVAALQRCLLKNLETLKEGRFASGWAEVIDVLDMHGWPRFESRATPARQ